MTRALFFTFAVLLLTTFVGCAGEPSTRQDGVPPEVADQDSSKTPIATPYDKKAALAATAEKIAERAQKEQKRRTLEEMQSQRDAKDALEKRVEKFWKYIKSGDVNTATSWIAEGIRAEEKRGLFNLLSKHGINRFRVDEMKIDYAKAGYSAKVEGVLLLFEKGSVATSKREISQQWKYIDLNWLMVGSE